MDMRNDKDTKMYDKPIGETNQHPRRYFLGTLAGLAGSVVTLNVLSPHPGPVERSLHEADFYKPHHLAG
jgi:hypothetical protein